jgi:hypothetical protein
MSSAKKRLTIRIPKFQSNRYEWRREINAAVFEALQKHGVQYTKDDKLDVEVRLYLRGHKLSVLDVDNRLKDVCDALQGFVGDKGKRGELKRIIPDDSQIYRLVAEKRKQPKSDPETRSLIEIRRYTRHRGTARTPRDARKHVMSGGVQQAT